LFGLFLLVFTAEKKFNESKHQSFFQILKMLPKFMTNKRLRTLLVYMFLTRICRGFYGEALSLQYINNGLERTTLVNIGTLITPIALIIACFSNKFLKKGKLMQYYHNVKMYGWLIEVFNYLVYLYLVHSKNVDVTVWLIVLVNMIGIIADQTFNFFFGFVNLIIDEEMGSSSITVMTSIWNISNDVPNTIGLSILKRVNFNVLIITCLVIGMVILLWQRKTAKLIDASDLNE
jgi:hypothetical protein